MNKLLGIVSGVATVAVAAVAGVVYYKKVKAEKVEETEEVEAETVETESEEVNENEAEEKEMTEEEIRAKMLENETFEDFIKDLISGIAYNVWSVLKWASNVIFHTVINTLMRIYIDKHFGPVYDSFMKNRKVKFS